MKIWLISTTLLINLLITSPLLATTFKTEQWQTAKGTQVIFYPAMEVPMVDISIAFASGSAYDGKSYGLSALTTNLLDQGNEHFDANQIAEKLADVGAQFNSETSRDMTALQLKTLTDDNALKQSLNIFSLIINKPNFKQEAFMREKNQQIMAVMQSQESPNEVANLLFFNKLYQNHPYAHAINGTIDSIKSLSLPQVRSFYHRYFVASNAVIVIVGAIDLNKAHDIAEQLTQNLPKGEPAPTIPTALSLQTPEEVNVNFASSQTILRLGQLGISHTNPDYFPLLVGNYILGGGSLVSRLSNDVREKRGLTYGIYSQFIPMPGEGPFLISLSTKRNQTKTALTVTKKTLEDFLITGPTADELVAAKQYLIGSFPLSLASNSNIAAMLLRIAFYHLPADYLNNYTDNIEKITLKDIKNAFDHQINPSKMLLVSVGKV